MAKKTARRKAKKATPHKPDRSLGELVSRRLIGATETLVLMREENDRRMMETMVHPMARMAMSRATLEMDKVLMLLHSLAGMPNLRDQDRDNLEAARAATMEVKVAVSQMLAETDEPNPQSLDVGEMLTRIRNMIDAHLLADHVPMVALDHGKSPPPASAQPPASPSTSKKSSAAKQPSGSLRKRSATKAGCGGAGRKRS